MKKTILFSICTLLIVYLQAQDKIISFGLHGGINSSTVTFSDYDRAQSTILPNFRNKYGYQFGLDLRVKPTSKFSIPITVDYMQRSFGSKSDIVISVTDPDGNIKEYPDNIDYKIPQLALSAGLGIKLIPFLTMDLKPYFTYNISDVKSRLKGVTEWDKNFLIDYKSDFGIIGQLQFDFTKLSVNAGIMQGIAEVESLNATDESGVQIGKFGMRNTAYFMNIGYKF